MYPCQVCYEDASLVCSGCKTSRYCSPKCQMIDWKEGHKKGCKIQQVLNEYNEKHEKTPTPRPESGRCTGCNKKFSGESYCDVECSECGYQACEICSSHHSRGTCHCPNSNFGNMYCEMEPRWYHADGRTGASYRGDRHPDESYGYSDEHYEAHPRKCGSCGEVVRMLKPEFAKPH